MSEKLREAVQAIVNRWDDDRSEYRGRVVLMQLKAALADTTALPSGEPTAEELAKWSKPDFVRWYNEYAGYYMALDDVLRKIRV